MPAILRNLVARAPKMEDLEAVTELLLACDMGDDAVSASAKEDLLRQWRRADCNVKTDAWVIIKRIFTTRWVDPSFPLLMLILVLAVWLYEFLYSAGLKTRFVLELAQVRVGLVVLMIAYLAIIAQPSTKAFIYFQF